MQLTKAEEYGIFGAMYLAQANESRVVPLSEISEAMDIPEKFLAKIFQSLSRNGVVRSHRGVQGGFTLSRDPSTISIREVLETIQGSYHFVICTEDMNLCAKGYEFCSIREMLVIAERRLLEVFEALSLADLVEWQKTGNIPKKVAVFA